MKADTVKSSVNYKRELKRQSEAMLWFHQFTPLRWIVHIGVYRRNLNISLTRQCWSGGKPGSCAKPVHFNRRERLVYPLRRLTLLTKEAHVHTQERLCGRPHSGPCSCVQKCCSVVMSVFRSASSRLPQAAFPLVPWLGVKNPVHPRLSTLTCRHRAQCSAWCFCSRAGYVTSSSQWALRRAFRCWFQTLQSNSVCETVRECSWRNSSFSLSLWVRRHRATNLQRQQQKNLLYSKPLRFGLCYCSIT